jgi:hypothetical protein
VNISTDQKMAVSRSDIRRPNILVVFSDHILVVFSDQMSGRDTRCAGTPAFIHRGTSLKSWHRGWSCKTCASRPLHPWHRIRPALSTYPEAGHGINISARLVRWFERQMPHLPASPEALGTKPNMDDAEPGCIP